MNLGTAHSLFHSEIYKTDNYPSFREQFFYAWSFALKITSTPNSTEKCEREVGLENISSSHGIWVVLGTFLQKIPDATAL